MATERKLSFCLGVLLSCGSLNKLRFEIKLSIIHLHQKCMILPCISIKVCFSLESQQSFGSEKLFYLLGWSIFYFLLILSGIELRICWQWIEIEGQCLLKCCGICFWFIDYTEALTVWITTNCGKFWKRWEYQTTWPASCETCMQVKKQQLEPDMEEQTSQNLERSMSKLYIVTLLIWLTYRVNHEKCWAGWSTSQNQDCLEKYQ